MKDLSSSDAEVLHRPFRRVLVLYGSETGNSQDVAERIVREAKLKHYAPILMSMESYDIKTLPNESCVVFVTSTTGQGEEPRNMKSFWRFLLRKSLSETSLTNVSYCVFGLGDSGYQKFNITAKKLFRRLSSLGARAIQPLGLGDDQHPLGYEAALNPWLQEVWKSMRQMFPLPSYLKELSEDEISKLPLPGSRFCVDVIETLENLDESKEHSESKEHGKQLMEGYWAFRLAVAAADAHDAALSFSQSAHRARQSQGRTYYSGVVCANRQLTTKEAVKQVHHLELEPMDTSTSTSYDSGDVLGVLPHSLHPDDDNLTGLLKRMGFAPNVRVRIYPLATPEKRDSFPVIPLKYLIAGGIDVNSASPRRYFFEVMSHFTASEHENERLQYFASGEGAVDLYKYNQRERRTVFEIFDDFPSLKPSLEWFLHVAPHLHPRLYSISSSPYDTVQTRATHITVASVEWVTPMKRKRKGLCSSWLSSLTPGTKISYFVSKGNISLPPPDVPMILIGPGTGIAPFRSFVRTRLFQSQASDKGPVGDVLVFFGCRNALHDYLYEDEWKELQKSGFFARKNAFGGIVVAFSRPTQNEKKKYVQNRITDEEKRVWSFLEAGAKIFVAGAAEKMPTAVREAIQKVVQSQGSRSEKESSIYMTKMDTNGRYFVDAW